MKSIFALSLLFLLCSFNHSDKLVKVGEPTEKQINAAKKKIAAHIAELTKNNKDIILAGNFGYVQGSLQGGAKDFSVTEKTALLVSSGRCTHKFPLYEAQVVGFNPVKKEYVIGPPNYDGELKNGIEYWKRCTDSEFKMLNDLGTTLGGIMGIVNKKVTGKLLIVSENKICLSCAGVIEGFKTMFPNVDCTIIDDISTRSK